MSTFFMRNWNFLKTILVSNEMDKNVYCIPFKANAGNVRQLKNFLQKHNLSIDHQDCNGLTALYLSVEWGLLTALTTLIAAGADVNISTSTKKTPLMLASEKSSLSCLQALIKAGARLDELDENGKPALLFAKDYESFEALIKSGACVNQRTLQGVPILVAVSGSLLEDVDYVDSIVKQKVKALLEAGAVVDDTDLSGITALMKAAHIREYDIVDMLLKARAVPNKQDNNGTTALMYACMAEDENPNTINLLLKAGADVDNTDHSGITALMKAAKAVNYDIVEMLLKAKADPNKQDNNGTTALMNACMAAEIHFSCWIIDKHLRTVQTLLEAGADVDITDYSGRTSLMIAAEDGNSSILERFLQVKADPNKQDRDGKTALMYTRNAKCIKVLISHGANVNLMDKAECRALDYSLQNLVREFHEICDDLSDSFSSVEELDDCPVIVLLENGSYPVINAKYRPCFEKIFLSNGVGYELLLSGATLVEFEQEISNKHKQLLRLLVCNGIADPYLTEETCVVQQALQWGQVDVLKYLIANCYLTLEDLVKMRAELGETFSQRSQDEEIDETQELLMNAFRKPWPLEKLAFIAVSSALGPSPGREERIPKTGLPDTIQRMLMFQEPVSRLPVSKWKDIPLWFDQ